MVLGQGESASNISATDRADPKDQFDAVLAQTEEMGIIVTVNTGTDEVVDTQSCHGCGSP